jgi:hypothetical protein
VLGLLGRPGPALGEGDAAGGLILRMKKGQLLGTTAVKEWRKEKAGSSGEPAFSSNGASKDCPLDQA